MTDKSVPNNTEKLIENFDKSLLYNSLENAVINDYSQLKEIKTKIKDSMMSGSGPTFFVLSETCTQELDKTKFNKYSFVGDFNGDCVSDVLLLIEFLGHTHCLAHGETQLACSLLLES